MFESAQQVILDRIRQALASAPDVGAAPRAYRRNDESDHAEIVAELIDRLEDYRARVTQVALAALPDAVADACAQYSIHQLAVPADIPAEWLPPNVTARRDSPPLSAEDLVQCNGVLTGCALAIAQTGTIVLNGGKWQGRRALSLVPDLHICVVPADQVVGILSEGIARLAVEPAQPITFISGPSATSDIELSRVEGVHGPRTLHVLLC